MKLLVIVALLVPHIWGAVVIDTLSSTQTQAFVDAHNFFRSGHLDTPSVTWDAVVETQIKDWLTSTGCRYEHTSSSTNPTPVNINGIGENLYQEWMSNGVPALKPMDTTKAWYDEILNYNWANPSGSSGVIGHFTQVVWKESIAIGCGTCSPDGTGTRTVMCRYKPLGNFLDGSRWATWNAAYGAMVGLQKTNVCPSTNPCLNGGTCVNGAGTTQYTCNCINGYTGTTCQTSPPPPPPPSPTPGSSGSSSLQTAIVAKTGRSWSSAGATAASGWCSGGITWPAGSLGAVATGYSINDQTTLVNNLWNSYSYKFTSTVTRVGCTICPISGGYYYLRCVYGGSTMAALKDEVKAKPDHLGNADVDKKNNIKESNKGEQFLFENIEPDEDKPKFVNRIFGLLGGGVAAAVVVVGAAFVVRRRLAATRQADEYSLA